MSWFKKLLKKILLSESTGVVKDSYSHHLDDPFLTFSLYSAIGGKIIEFRRLANLNSHQTLYVINDDENLVERLNKIITLELLKGQ